MMVASGFGFMELLVLLFVGGGNPMPLPVGLPPMPEDVKLAQAAPQDPLAYITWSGVADADPKSANQTEQLLAEPQVQLLFKTLGDEIVGAIERGTARGDKEGAIVGKTVPRLLRIALTHPTAIWFEKFAFDPNTGPVIEAGLIVNVGKEKNEVSKYLDELEGLISQQLGQKIEVLPAGQGGLRKLPLPQGAPTVAWDFEGDYLLIALGDGTAGRLRKSITAGQGAGPKWLTDIKAKLGVKRQSSLVYINAGQLLRQFGPMLGQRMGGRDGAQMFTKVLGALGLDKVTTISGVTGLDDTGIVSRSFVATEGEPGGLFKLVAGKPLTPADLADVSRDSDVALVARLNAGEIYDELLKVINDIDPRAKGQFDEGVAEMERDLGFKLKGDLIDSLGDVWTIYNSADAGGLVITGLTGVVKVKDRAKAQKVIDKLAALMEEDFNRRWRNNPNQWRKRAIQFKKVAFEGQTITFMNPIGDDWVVAPAWCLTDDRLIVAPYPQMVKAYLSRQAARKAGGAVDSLADLPRVKKLFEASTGPTMISYLDTPGLFRKLYPLLHAGATLLCAEIQSMPGGDAINIDMSLLPTASVIQRHLAPDTGTVTRMKDGVLAESRGTLPLASTATLLPLAGMVMWTSVRHDMAMAHDHAPAVGPIEIGPPPIGPPGADNGPAVVAPRTLEEKRKKAMADLNKIGVAIFLYHADKKKAPDALGDLTPNYLKAIETDPWGQAYVYLGKGQTPAAANSGKVPFAATAHAPGNARVVLYGDGHVEVLAEGRFKQHMEAAGIKYEAPKELKDDGNDPPPPRTRPRSDEKGFEKRGALPQQDDAAPALR